MKSLNKKISVNKNTSKITPTVSVDKKLDNIKNVNFISNKIEEVNKVINNFELTY